MTQKSLSLDKLLINIMSVKIYESNSEELMKSSTIIIRRFSLISWINLTAKKLPQYDKRRSSVQQFIMQPSSLGGGRILRRTLSVCPSVRPSRYRASRGAT